MNYKNLKDSLKEVLSTQATSYDYEDTMNFLIEKSIEFGADDFEVDEHDNIYITKGKAKAYPCVVSHTDTVHDIYKEYKVYQVKGNFVAFDSDSMQQVGTGGDDKVGMWVCLEMLRKFDNIKICFFAQEEIGCIGSSKAKAEFFDDVGYAFECDRKGNGDFVQESSGVKMFGDVFKEAIKSTLNTYGYKITTGGLTDVHEISQIANIACANMSCGYYKPHSKQEYVNIEDAINTCKMVGALITKLGEVRYDHEAEDSYSSYGNWSNHSAYGYSSYKSKPTKKISNKSKLFTGCDMCGAISTDGCDFCTTDYKSETNEDTLNIESQGVAVSTGMSYACSCGGSQKSFRDSEGEFLHCATCGMYKPTSVPF